MRSWFSRFQEAAPDRIHAAAHSHHPWPDITFAAHQRAWEDAARLADDKWDYVFGVLMPETKSLVADVLSLPVPDTLAFAPNTHEFILRIASSLPRPFSVLTSNAEFHSFSRQVARWEEAGVATVTRVRAEPFDTFPERLVTAYDRHDLVFFSQVHSRLRWPQYTARSLTRPIDALPAWRTIASAAYQTSAPSRRARYDRSTSS